MTVLEKLATGFRIFNMVSKDLPVIHDGLMLRVTCDRLRQDLHIQLYQANWQLVEIMGKGEYTFFLPARY